MRSWISITLLCLVVAGCGPRHQAWTQYGALELRNSFIVQPLNMHLGVWEDVIECLGDDARNQVDPVEDIEWIVADSLIDWTIPGLIYGATIYDPSLEGKEWVIIIEASEWFTPHTPSHEMIHVLGNARGHPPHLFRCVFPEAVRHPFRPIIKGG